MPNIKLKDIKKAKDCKECNCFKECIKYAGMKSYVVEKDIKGCCAIKKM